ncbi:hypothetical protein BDZ89DRAFT_1218001 [Hymenopellis radicata]|nr:hypothetical protein BDZ89DRAFT_1218001 [Hymenopellis radicata]
MFCFLNTQLQDGRHPILRHCNIRSMQGTSPYTLPIPGTETIRLSMTCNRKVTCDGRAGSSEAKSRALKRGKSAAFAHFQVFRTSAMRTSTVNMTTRQLHRHSSPTEDWCSPCMPVYGSGDDSTSIHPDPGLEFADSMGGCACVIHSSLGGPDSSRDVQAVRQFVQIRSRNSPRRAEQLNLPRSGVGVRRRNGTSRGIHERRVKTALMNSWEQQGCGEKSPRDDGRKEEQSTSIIHVMAKNDASSVLENTSRPGIATSRPVQMATSTNYEGLHFSVDLLAAETFGSAKCAIVLNFVLIQQTWRPQSVFKFYWIFKAGNRILQFEQRLLSSPDRLFFSRKRSKRLDFGRRSDEISFAMNVLSRMDEEAAAPPS